MTMEPRDIINLTRRDFLVNASRGVGGLALASLLARDGLLATEAPTRTSLHAARLAHFAARAKNCIFLYMEGGVSQIGRAHV